MNRFNHLLIDSSVTFNLEPHLGSNSCTLTMKIFYVEGYIYIYILIVLIVISIFHCSAIIIHQS